MLFNLPAATIQIYFIETNIKCLYKIGVGRQYYVIVCSIYIYVALSQCQSNFIKTTHFYLNLIFKNNSIFVLGVKLGRKYIYILSTNRVNHVPCFICFRMNQHKCMLHAVLTDNNSGC